MNTVIIDYDAGNVKSLQFALERLGVRAVLTNDRELIASANRVIFPVPGSLPSLAGTLTFVAILIKC